MTDEQRHDSSDLGHAVIADDGGTKRALASLIIEVLELAFAQELTEHLGYHRHQRTAAQKRNARNGSYAKTLRTSVGEVTVQIPRDRNGTFVPALVPKGQRHAHEVEARVMSMLLTGAHVGDVAAHLNTLYDTRLPERAIETLSHNIHRVLEAWRD